VRVDARPDGAPHPLPAPAREVEQDGANRVGELVALLAELPDPVRSVLLIGHNPGLEELGDRLDPRGAREPLRTAVLLTFELGAPFAAVASGGRLVARFVPR
jgi:phosphohistidine phosphatase SixA